MPEEDWKITGQQKMILDYPCMMASRTDTAGVVTKAWFTPAIPVSTGPSIFSNLPGLVLEVDIDDGSRTFTAKSIKLEEPEKGLLKKPKDGKKVTQDEYDEIVVDEKCKTNIDGVFAAGDVTTVPYKQIVVAAGHGCIASLSAFEYISKMR